jgi:hypothetical protein
MMSLSSWSLMRRKSTDGIRAGKPPGLTPWRTMRSKSAARKPAVRPPDPRVRLGPRIRPMAGTSIIVPPLRSAPWQAVHT